MHKNEVFLRQKYLEEKLSTNQIAKLCFSSRSTVAASLRAFNIPLRTEDEAHGLNKGQLGYGERKVKNETLEHKRELQTVAKMQELRNQGFSYWKIAEILNTMKIPTKNRKKWYATTVMNLLKKNS